MSKKVLVVDDAAFMRMMLKDILTKNGFEIVGEAENGAVGIVAYQKFKPDIVTMDITMPEMNGIDAVKAIKTLDAGAKIVMVSAMGQQSMVIEAIQAGASDFIVKPFQPERVIDALTKVLG
ncbi:MAG: response regulator [Synergistaceae bacterium]|nr:response regulator [Synergistaceae bacterium]